MTTDPDQARCSSSTRRAKKRGIRGAFTPAQWRLAVSVYGGPHCLCCQATDRPLTADHVIPLVKGGRNVISNIQMLCEECNGRKGERVFDYRPLDKILTLRRILTEQGDQSRTARAARLARIESLYAWCWFAAQAHNRSNTAMSNTNDQTTGAAGSTVARYDQPITTLDQMAAALDQAGVSYDDDSLAAMFETFGNSRGYVVQLHAHHDVMNQFRAMLTMGACVLGWADSAPIVAYVEGQMIAAGLDFSRDVPAVELLERAWIYMADGMGPIDAYWQATMDWEDQELDTTPESAEWRAILRERSAQARERYNAQQKARAVELARASDQRAAQRASGAADE